MGSRASNLNSQTGPTIGGAGPPLVWEHVAGEGYAGAVVAEGRLFFFDRHDGQARLTCLNPETGAELWRQEYPSIYDDYYGYSRGPRAQRLSATPSGSTVGSA